jgi:hypothetical protein
MGSTLTCTTTCIFRSKGFIFGCLQQHTIRIRLFLKSIDCWKIVETGWTKPADATPELVLDKNSQVSNDKALYALCQALSLSTFARISKCESAQEAW